MKVNGYIIPEKLYYNKEHEWIQIMDDGDVRVGITDYAQKMLKEITFIYFPEKGETFNIFETICTVESIKAISELYNPFTGKIRQVNAKLKKKPSLINEDPYGKGWIVTIFPLKGIEEAKKLINAEQYAAYIKELIKVDSNLLIYKWKEKDS
jgi:glycine cleavage system H protein